MLIRILLGSGFLCAAILACTNLNFGQTAQRFSDNMGGQIAGFANPTVGSPSSFSFSAMGYTHIGSSGGTVMQRALQQSKSDGDAFAVVAGDLTNTGIDSELATWRTQVAAVALPVFPAIGNHDIFFGGWNRYKSIIGRSIYSFDAGDVHFTVLDSANGTFGEDQLHWLEDDLRATRKPLKAIMMHFPIYIGEFSSLYKISSDEEVTIFKSLMYKYGVQLVISGHYHGHGESVVGGTKYLVTGQCNSILDIANRTGYVKITVSGGAFHTRQIFMD
jgi:3',5'-cyclic AMP phosphodiesterase CpdA